MRPLSTSQEVLTWLGVFPSEESASLWKKSAYAIVSYTILFANILFLLSAMLYLKQNMLIDVKASLYSAFQILGYSEATYSFVIILFCREKFIASFNRLSEIYDSSKYPITNTYIFLGGK